jgi:hydrogenase/urease accessory protein HupE
VRALAGLILALAAWLIAAPSVFAHEVRPAFLEIVQDGPDHFEATWKQPALGDIAVRLAPHLSNGWLERSPDDQFATSAFLIKRWSISAKRGQSLPGVSLTIEGLNQTITDVLVRIRMSDGRAMDAILRPDHPSVVLEFARVGGLPVLAYLRLGVEHILTGTDHLMFVLGLLLLVGIRWRLIKAITAFTLAHSLTLAASAVGWVHVSPPIVESLVALSIVFVAAELAGALQGRSGLTHRYPWVIAFTFGLLHGFAFAGALAEVGLPPNAIPASLFLFNVGVEMGQLLFVGCAIGVILALRWVWPRVPSIWTEVSRRLPPYAIGSFAAYWFIERVTVAFS